MICINLSIYFELLVFGLLGRFS